MDSESLNMRVTLIVPRVYVIGGDIVILYADDLRFVEAAVIQVYEKVKVAVKFKCGDTNSKHSAGTWYWGSGGSCFGHTIVAYKLLETEVDSVQSSLELASQFKVALFNTDITHELVAEGDHQRKIIFTDPFGNTSCVKFEKPKAVDLKVTIQLPGQIEETVLPIRLIYKKPIKTTYTFWLGAGGEVVDEQ